MAGRAGLGGAALNLAVRDVHVLADAIVAWYGSRDPTLLDAYSETCLRRVWRAEHFSDRERLSRGDMTESSHALAP